MMGRYATGVINVRHAWHATGRPPSPEFETKSLPKDHPNYRKDHCDQTPFSCQTQNLSLSLSKDHCDWPKALGGVEWPDKGGPGKKARAHRALDCGCMLSCHPQTQAAAARALVVEGGKLSAPYALCCASPSSKWPPSTTDYSLTRTPSGCCHPLDLACLAGPELLCRLRAVDANQHDNYTHMKLPSRTPTSCPSRSRASGCSLGIPCAALAQPACAHVLCRLELSCASSQRPAQH